VRTEVSIPLPDGDALRAVVATPASTAPVAGWRGAVVVHEVFGVAPEMLDVADRFAAEGWAAVVPDLFSHGTRVGCLVRAMRESASGEQGPVSADIEAARRWLANRSDVDGDRLAVVGFCLGGGLALAYAVSAPPGVRAASVNYGQVPRDQAALERVCPVVGSYGGQDRVYGRQAARLERHLKAWGIPHDVKLYPEAGHSFMTDGHHPIGKLIYWPMHLRYSAQDADDAWTRMFAFFDQQVTA
jgi:carboxymethylenebutenolidase